MLLQLRRRKVDWKAIKVPEVEFPYDPSDEQLQLSFSLSSERFLADLSYFVRSFFPQFLRLYSVEKSFLFLSLYVDFVVYSYNLVCLLHYYSYKLVGRRRLMALRNKDYNGSLAKKPYDYRETLFKKWRLKFRKKPKPNVPVVYEVRLVNKRFIAVARSFRLLELRAFSAVNYSNFSAKFFYRNPRRKAVYLFIFSYLWMDLAGFLALRSYIYSWFVVRYNEYIAHAVGVRPYVRHVFLRRSRRSYFKMHGMLEFFLLQYAIFFYFGHFVLCRQGQLWWKRRIFFWRTEATIYKGLVSVLPLLLNPELLFQWRHISGSTVTSVFYLESIKYYFMLFSYFLLQYSPKRYAISKCWVHRWIHFFNLSSYFKKLMFHFGCLLFLALEYRLVLGGLSREIFLDCQLIDALTIKSFGNDWNTVWLERLLRLHFVDYIDVYRRLSLSGFMRYLLHWERISILFQPPAYLHARLVCIVLLLFRLFRIAPVNSFLPFSLHMYVLWDIIHIDLVRDFFAFHPKFPSFFSSICFDTFMADYFNSVNFFFYTILNGFVDFKRRSSYAGRGRWPKRHKFLIPLSNYLYYFFARDVLFKLSFLSLLLPVAYYFLFDQFLPLLKRRRNSSLLHGHFLQFRAFFTAAQAKVFIPKGPEFFQALAKRPHWDKFYAKYRSRFYRHWMHLTPFVYRRQRPFRYKWIRVYGHDWKAKRLLAPNFFFMIYGRPRPRGRKALKKESRCSLPSIVY